MCQPRGDAVEAAQRLAHLAQFLLAQPAQTGPPPAVPVLPAGEYPNIPV